jgi:hypothetical protein
MAERMARTHGTNKTPGAKAGRCSLRCDGTTRACPDQVESPSFVMRAHSASKTRVNALMGAGIHVFSAANEDVDGRDKPGHDAD